ncbi:MAG TPA: pyridoxamine 5'-phosphate oxidase family protein [Candidatus Saccharimonadia bacterium]|nr:pyridoxamine 5'-phosphate oxidase family protein [Candidatus Saccharimonadia bacterium]
MADFDWTTHLKDCLESTKFMAVSTRGTKGLWNHAVNFAYDSALNFYFMSQPGSRHMQNISANGEIALAIFSTNQNPENDAVGMQIRGEATVLADDQVPQAHVTYFRRTSAIAGIPSELSDFLGPAAPWKFVKVEPEEIGYFNSRQFGEHRQTVPVGITL